MISSIALCNSYVVRLDKLVYLKRAKVQSEKIARISMHIPCGVMSL